ncbi:MAG: glycosyltransferase family 2 protein [Thermovenabulum sp.]|mgnify:CR=1 FL=1|uniref:glycosyltransferase family 2 protein n=1 Tax=Thermovenabulum sp. TaxID=3100335 RepID=UPI003C79D853
MKISAVIPAYNEAKKIESVIDSLKKIKEINEIIVVNDGSTDDTGKKAEIKGVKVVNLKKNHGKGYACFAGFKEAEGDIILFLDADIKFDREDILALINPIIHGEADMTVAGFKKTSNIKEGGFGITKGFARVGIYVFTKKFFNFPLSGQRAVKRKFLEELKCFPKGYGMEVGITIDVIKKGGRVKEILTNMHHEGTKKDLKGFVHRGKQLLDILYTFVQKIIQ